MTKTILILGAALALSGCGVTLAEIEAADDAACRQVLAQRAVVQPGAYELCRQNAMSLRRDRTIVRAAAIASM
jgi:hypothetical protein